MVAIPDQLVWELTRKNSSFLRKKNGKNKRQGTISLSAEPANVSSLHLFQFSGIANSKCASVECSDDNKAQLVMKVASKSGTSPKGSFRTSNVNKDFKRSVESLLKQTSGVHYRTDLKKALLGKYTKCYQANRRAKGITKPVPTKKGRGTL